MLQPVLKPNTLPSPRYMFSPILIHYFGKLIMSNLFA